MTNDYRGLIARERVRQGMTMHQFAERCGVSVSTVSRFEAGKEASFENVVAMLTNLGVPLMQPGPCPHEYVCRFCGLIPPTPTP